MSLKYKDEDLGCQVLLVEQETGKKSENPAQNKAVAGFLNDLNDFIHVETGTISYSVSVSSMSKMVYFKKSFRSVPVVNVYFIGNSPIGLSDVYCSDISTTGFKIKCSNAGGNIDSGSIRWVAMETI